MLLNTNRQHRIEWVKLFSPLIFHRILLSHLFQMTINGHRSKKLGVLRCYLICLFFFSCLFMGPSSKYKQQSRRDQCAVYNHWVIGDTSWLSWSCQEKSLSGHKIDSSLPLHLSLSTSLYPPPLSLPLRLPSLSTGVSGFFHFSILGLEHSCTCS